MLARSHTAGERERAEGRERLRDNTPLWALVSSSGSTSPVSVAGGGSQLQSPKEAGAQFSVFAPPPGPYPRHLGGSRQQDASPGTLKMPNPCDLWEAGVSLAGEQAPVPTVAMSFPSARERQLQKQGLYLPLAV